MKKKAPACVCLMRNCWSAHCGSTWAMRKFVVTGTTKKNNGSDSTQNQVIFQKWKPDCVIPQVGKLSGSPLSLG